MVANFKSVSLTFRLLAASAIAAIASPVTAGDLTVSVKDSNGSPLEHAVVQLFPKFALSSPLAEMPNAEMRQQNTLFEPFVLPVRVGTSVSFPNLDEARHHVYSFSSAKPFELRLYGKDVSNSIIFDNAGIVALGCNIHDNMLAYILVTESPIYLKTNVSGDAVFQGLENGSYDVSVWHPGQKDRDNIERWAIDITDGAISKEFSTEMRRVWGQQRDPAEGQY